MKALEEKYRPRNNLSCEFDHLHFLLKFESDINKK